MIHPANLLPKVFSDVYLPSKNLGCQGNDGGMETICASFVCIMFQKKQIQAQTGHRQVETKGGFNTHNGS